jgi:hypothetical protein
LGFLVFPVGEPSLGEKKVNPISSSWGNPLGEIRKIGIWGFLGFFGLTAGEPPLGEKRHFA